MQLWLLAGMRQSPGVHGLPQFTGHPLGMLPLSVASLHHASGELEVRPGSEARKQGAAFHFPGRIMYQTRAELRERGLKQGGDKAWWHTCSSG